MPIGEWKKFAGSTDSPIIIPSIFIPGWANGRHAAIDVSIVSPLQSQLIRKAAEEPGSAAVKRFREKMTKYYTPCENEGIQFFPAIVETFGGWHPDSEKILIKLAQQLASHTGVPSEETSRHFFQRLGILLVRGNAALITTRTPTFVDPVVDGDLDY